MTKLDEAIDRLNKKFNGRFGQPTWCTSDGKEYVEITCGGIKEEGCVTPAFARSYEKAVEMWENAVMQYALCAGQSHNGTLCLEWRALPDVISFEVEYDNICLDLPKTKMMLFSICSRLFIGPLMISPSLMKAIGY